MDEETREYHKEEDRQEREQSFYNDWLTDNLYELRDTFIEENPDLFNQYCKDSFEEYMSFARLNNE